MVLLAGNEEKKIVVKKKKKKCLISATNSFLVAIRQNNGFLIETQEYCGKLTDERKDKNCANKKSSNNEAC